MSKCRACNQTLTWRRTAAGRPMPCEPGLTHITPDASGPVTVVTADGRTIRGRLTEPGAFTTEAGAPGGDPGPAKESHVVAGLRPHWSNCPGASAYRKGRQA